MGQQIETRARLGGKLLNGRAMLETDYVLFRPAAKKESAGRVKIPFRDVQSLDAACGWLRIRHPAGSLELELGPRAGKWAEKIRSPRGLLDKLGVTRGAAVSIVGAADSEFRR